VLEGVHCYENEIRTAEAQGGNHYPIHRPPHSRSRHRIIFVRIQLICIRYRRVALYVWRGLRVRLPLTIEGNLADALVCL
jgi:hypothetical protein